MRHPSGSILDEFPEFERVRIALAELFLDHHLRPLASVMPKVERHLFEEWRNFPRGGEHQLPQCTAHELAEAMSGRMEREGAPPEIVERFRAKFWDRYGTPKR